MAATVAGILLHGDHASRPAASAPPVGSVYSCSDHDLVYVTDGASWSTWADLTGTPVDYGETGDIGASAPGDTADGGALSEAARADHRHARESFATITAGLDYGEAGDIVASAPGDTAAAGATGEVADAGHRHARESYATITAGLDYGETGDVVTQAYSDAADGGALNEVARADHRHGMPAAASIDWGETGDIVTQAYSDAADAGALDEAARADHRHGMPAAGSIDYAETGDMAASAPGDAADGGASSEVSRGDHKHARTTERVVYEYVIDGGGSTITTGVKGGVYVPDAFTITGAVLLADQTGSIVVDVWMDSYANHPPTVADTITASAKPTISSANKAKDTTLTGWTTAVPADRVLYFNVDSVTTIQRVTVAIFGYRS